MLLTLLRELGINYDPYAYNGDEDNPPDGECAPTLDPISTSTVGRLRNKQLVAAAETLPNSAIMTATLRLLLDGFGAISVPNPTQSKKYTAAKLIPTLLLLITWGILRPITDHCHDISTICALFLVAKGASKLRLIFDGRPLNSSLESPPPVNLPGIGDVLCKLSARGSSRLWLADYRHYFHQFRLSGSSIPCAVSIESMIQVPSGTTGHSPRHPVWTKLFAYTTLPMGISWAPAIAQCASWVMLAYREEGAIELFRLSEHTDLRIGQFADVVNSEGKVVGFACFVYDNLFVSLDSSLSTLDADRLEGLITKRLLSNAKYFNAEFKDCTVYSADGFVNLLGPMKRDRAGKLVREPLTEEKLPIFLGVQLDPFSIDGVLCRWRHGPKYMSKIEGILADPIFNTPRRIARVIGILVWNSLVTMTCLSTIRLSISILKEIVPAIRTKSDWDKVCSSPSTKWFEFSMGHLKDITSNPWTVRLPTKASFVVFAASDASDDIGGGLILFGPSVHNLRQGDSFRFSERPSTHIFLKEALALMNTVKFILDHAAFRGLRNYEIRLACDNIPVRQAFMKGYSTNDVVDDMIQRTRSLITARGVSLVCVDICTTKNVADCLTRNDHGHKNLRVCESRYVATWNVLHGTELPREGVARTNPASRERLAWIEYFAGGNRYPLPPAEDWHVSFETRSLGEDF